LSKTDNIAVWHVDLFVLCVTVYVQQGSDLCMPYCNVLLRDCKTPVPDEPHISQCICEYPLFVAKRLG